ncbi:hypothetical protein BVG16_00505 [Paenibacillus selenitireducens]|uniref:ATP-grasp domain-containing protein n=1 Tax=Paenibacillus selenitireducens TaxID=1324314 RepID=A0A1T2XM99_9BACL|nr:YheC/YheD family protein [Paenibacillus selenitireducens]OPA80866.1 hypothetical protein BVG16_00505 [Paenibacillus selenitireducens]
MSKTKISIQVTSSGVTQEDVLMIGESTIKQWKIPTHQYVMLQFGSFKEHVKIVSVPKYNGLRIQTPLARRMGLFSGAQLRFHFRNGTLRLGPLISVLVTRDDPDNLEKPFGTITLFCKELVDACRSQGAYVYFFTPEHIGSSTNSIQGWVYHERWQKVMMPIADVINNRLTSRKFENKPSVQQFLKEVKSRYNTQFFNEKFLDKTEVFDALRGDPALQRYLPESRLLRNYAGLKTMCAKYSTVFLKPVRGSLGKGIIRISRQGTMYLAQYATINGTKKLSYPSLLKLFESLSGKMKTTKYQMQQGLMLIDNTSRPVDFRALVQKNATGKWHVTSIVGRIAGSNHFVSNLARGGSLSTVKEAVMKSNLPQSVKGEAHLKLHKAALEISKGIDTRIPAHFGELGIDLALDTSGHVWLLEVNSKPSKNDNTPLRENKIRPSVKQMIEYSRFLSGF